MQEVLKEIEGIQAECSAQEICTIQFILSNDRVVTETFPEKCTSEVNMQNFKFSYPHNTQT